MLVGLQPCGVSQAGFLTMGLETGSLRPRLSAAPKKHPNVV